MGFAVVRTSREFVRPSAATPSSGEPLELSIIDRVVGLRHLVRSLHIFAPTSGAVGGEDDVDAAARPSSPASVIKEALGKALVDYYPFAGRFVDGDGGPGSARVECTGEGAWFVEAVAGCSLDDVNRLDHPLMIPEDDLLPDAAPGVQPLDLPLMMQVTEFSCGGFVVGLISVHTLADGLGAGQFINAVGDYARGLDRPRVSPIWAREAIPSPPKLPPGPPPELKMFQLRHVTVDLSLDSINKVKSSYFTSTGHRCSTFDVAIAKTWQARTRSLRLPDPSSRVNLCFFANTRHLMAGAAWPDGGNGGKGFYGNCFYPVSVVAESGAVEAADVAGVVGMIREAKARLPADFARWAVADFKEDPYELSFTYDFLFVSDWTRLGFLEADYGWGTPSHVIPFAYYPFMAVAIIGAPPVPKTGARIMTQCVEDEHLPAFKEEIKAFDKDGEIFAETGDL
uniref:Acyl transferase 4 n=1 Tax=Oryza punctata TaxID=4537 RepID=A0A0E0JHC3_ORYPU